MAILGFCFATACMQEADGSVLSMAASADRMHGGSDSCPAGRHMSCVLSIRQLTRKAGG